MFEGLVIFEPRYRSGEDIPERTSSVERGDRLDVTPVSMDSVKDCRFLSPKL